VKKGIATVKEYLTNCKQPDAATFSSKIELGLGCTVESLIQYLDPAGEYRAQVNAMAGPEATVPKQVERFHAELLDHIDMVDSVSLKTQERDLTVELGNLRLADLFAEPKEETPKVAVDFHPLQELVGALGLGMVGGGDPNPNPNPNPNPRSWDGRRWRGTHRQDPLSEWYSHRGDGGQPHT